jgi:hypothetical protein
MLKQRGRWRSWLRLKGRIWYYDDSPKTSLFTNPGLWSACVAAISTILTAIFAWQNFQLNKTNFSLAHPPKLALKAIAATPDNLNRSVFHLIVVLHNSGDSDAESIGLFDTSLVPQGDKLVLNSADSVVDGRYTYSHTVGANLDGVIDITIPIKDFVGGTYSRVFYSEVQYADSAGVWMPELKVCRSFQVDMKGHFFRVIEADCPWPDAVQRLE